MKLLTIKKLPNGSTEIWVAPALQEFIAKTTLELRSNGTNYDHLEVDFKTLHALTESFEEHRTWRTAGENMLGAFLRKLTEFVYMRL